MDFSEEKTDELKKEQAAIKIQAQFRGFKIRKQMKEGIDISNSDEDLKKYYDKIKEPLDLIEALQQGFYINLKKLINNLLKKCELDIKDDGYFDFNYNISKYRSHINLGFMDLCPPFHRASSDNCYPSKMALLKAQSLKVSTSQFITDHLWDKKSVINFLVVLEVKMKN